MKHFITATILLGLLLASCSPTISAEPVSTPTQTATHTATPEPSPTLSPVEPLLEEYFTGQSIDVSLLNPADYKEFSVKLTEKMNEKRGINPVLYKDEAYINPTNYMMMNYDRHPDIVETITMYLAIAGRDGDGNLQIIDEKGQTVTIANSADVDWNAIITDPNDPRVDLANTGKLLESGLTTFQTNASEEGIIPIVLLDKNPGMMYFDGEANKGGKKLPIYHFYKIETDQLNNPIFARKFLVFPGVGTFHFFIEGSKDDIPFQIFDGNISDSDLHKKLSTNSVYYIVMVKDQKSLYTNNIFANPYKYTGIVDVNEAYNVLNNSSLNGNDMIVYGVYSFFKKD